MIEDADILRDMELLQLLERDPEQGIALAISRYGKTVQWIVQHIIGNIGISKTVMEECVSDVFVQLWQSAGRFDTARGVPLASWVYSIARHVAMDYRRREHRQISSLPLEETALPVELDLDDGLAREQQAAILREVIDSLSLPDREIFIYRYFLELSVKDIAAILELSAKQVENKLYRGRLKLRRQLEQRGVIR